MRTCVCGRQANVFDSRAGPCAAAQPGIVPVWYLATDNAGLRIYAKSEYPDKLVYYLKPPNREYSMNREGIARDESCAVSYWWTCLSEAKKESMVETMQDWQARRTQTGPWDWDRGRDGAPARPPCSRLAAD